MEKVIKDCLFYYGSQVPLLAKTKVLKNTNVILQDYHPVVHQGLFKEFFPHCQRFLYLNVSHIHRNELSLYDINLKDLKYNPEWETYLLNLNLQSTADLIITKAKSLLKIEGVDGIFIDDLDFWCEFPEIRLAFTELLNKIKNAREREVKFIVNRGFPLWNKIEGLEAIVLENIYPEQIYTAREIDLSWFENLIRLNFSLMHFDKKEVPVFGLKYLGNDDDVEFDRDFESGEKRDSLYREMNKNILKTLKYERSFNQWPQQLIS